MMKALRELGEKGVDFGTESTLSARAYVSLIEKWKGEGYRFNLFYVWLPSADIAVNRVAARVKAGGHDIPTETIRRRYEKGLRNFKETYLPRADRWTVLDNSGPQYRVVAKGGDVKTEILIPEIWEQIHG